MAENNQSSFSKDDAYQTLGMINTWIGNMDTKVSFALALVGVLVGSVFEKGMPRVFTKIGEAEKLSQVSGGEMFGAVLVGLLYVSSFLCIVSFILSLTARIKTTTDSVFFFGTVGNKKLQDYKHELHDMTEDKMIEDLETQIHTNSGICNKKARWFKIGIKLLVCTVILWFICSVFQLL